MQNEAEIDQPGQPEAGKQAASGDKVA